MGVYSPPPPPPDLTQVERGSVIVVLDIMDMVNSTDGADITVVIGQMRQDVSHMILRGLATTNALLETVHILPSYHESHDFKHVYQ